jgi:hypothetical protein
VPVRRCARRRVGPKTLAAMAADSPTNSWRMSGQPAAHMAPRDHCSGAAGLPTFTLVLLINRSNRRGM